MNSKRIWTTPGLTRYGALNELTLKNVIKNVGGSDDLAIITGIPVNGSVPC